MTLGFQRERERACYLLNALRRSPVCSGVVGLPPPPGAVFHHFTRDTLDSMLSTPRGTPLLVLPSLKVHLPLCRRLAVSGVLGRPPVPGSHPPSTCGNAPLIVLAGRHHLIGIYRVAVLKFLYMFYIYQLPFHKIG